MDKQYVYKCPNCGGKVRFLKDINKWECEYCGNKYDHLFNEENTLELENNDRFMYFYKCPSCNYYFVSVAAKLDKCLYCNKKIDTDGKAICVNNFINFESKYDLNKKQIYELYLNKLFSVKDYIKDDYLNINFEFKHIFCDIYSGYTLLKYKDNTEKYLFFDLIIPNIDHDDYAFAFEITNNDSIIKPSYWNSRVEEIQDVALKLDDYKEKDLKDEIINACINHFSKKYKITNKKGIEVEDNLKKDGLAVLPIYMGKVGDCYQYIKGNSDESIDPIIRFPKKSEAYNKLLKEKKMNSLLSTLEWIGIVVVFLAVFASMIVSVLHCPDYAYTIIMIVIILFGILSFVSGMIAHKKKEYAELLSHSELISKEEYYEKLITECKFVKIMKVKK